MLRLGLAVSLAIGLFLPGFARAEDLPIIVTYELQKQRREARVSARNPRGFWIHQVAAQIERKVTELAMNLKEPVTVRVNFVVARDGKLVSKEVAMSSGNGAADKAALAMLDHAQPFPPMPASMSDAELSFALPVRFR